MKKAFLKFNAIILLLILISCKKEESKPQTDYSLNPPKYADTLERQYGTANQALYNIMKTIYLWDDQVPTIDYNAAIYNDNLGKLLDDLKFKTLDRFSFISDKQTTNQLFQEGEDVSKGISYDLLNEITLKISFVYPDSPGEKAGLHRGMTIRKMNGSDVLLAINNGTIGNILQQPTIKFEVIDSAGSKKEISVTDAVFKLKTVSKRSIIIQDGKRIGYLLFNSFLGTSTAELNDAFSYFNSNDISEFILDLRYNGGGYVHVANQLASFIAGKKGQGKTFMKYIYNKNLTQYNEPVLFTTLGNNLDIERVFIIGSKQTASASELVINSLKPFMTVKLIGNITYGKPVGFPAFGYKDKVIFPVLFKSTNALDEGEYYTGLIPDKFSLDGLDYPLGDVRENRLADALYYIKNGSFKSDVARTESFSERPFIPFGIKSVLGTF